MCSRCAIHAPSCGRQTCLLLLVTLLLPQACPFLIKVYWAIQYGMRYVSTLASPTFFFCTGFSGRALCGHWDAVLLDNALYSLPLPVSIVGFSGRALCAHWDAALYNAL